MPDEKPKKCFVVGPIGGDGTPTRTRADWLLKGIIRPVLKDGFGFEVFRADGMPQPGMIDSQVINAVIEADLVIADLSENNANAFYELAIRHMEERPVIHMIDREYAIPFDVRPFRTIHFGIATWEEQEAAKAALSEQVKQVLSVDYETDNPIIRARGKKRLRETASPEERTLLDSIEELAARMAAMERELSVLHSITSVEPKRYNSKLPVRTQSRMRALDVVTGKWIDVPPYGAARGKEEREEEEE
jgi:hypothetical protein